MNYEEKYMDYKEKLRLAKEALNSSSYDKRTIEYIFPELKESEDEKIREVIINVFNISEPDETWGDTDITTKDIIAWLEKQGEQKEIDYNEELKKCKSNPLYFFDKYVKVKFKEQKPAWSEEDEKGLGDALWAIEQARTIAKDENDMGNLWYAENWLKSLKERMKGE